MKLIPRERYLSINKFDPVEIHDFSILTGKNGSGKTQLLNSFMKGSNEIEGIAREQIAYFNYSDFSVNSNTPSQDKQLSNIRNQWSGRNSPDEKALQICFVKIREEFGKDRSNFEQWLLYAFTNTAFNVSDWTDKNLNTVVLADILESADPKESFSTNSYKLSKGIQYLFNSYFTDHVRLEEFQLPTFEGFRTKLIGLYEEYVHFAKDRLESILKSEHPNLHDVLSSQFDFGELVKRGRVDDESPYLFLVDLEEEEKEYQRNEHSIFFSEAYRLVWGENNVVLNRDDFFTKYGTSPIDQINEVLEKYDCNGYYLERDIIIRNSITEFRDAAINIRLKHKVSNIEIPFDSLSSGEKTLMALALYIYKASKTSLLPRVLLLDEVDSSLHPGKITDLLYVIEEVFIKRRKLKVILVTHSPTTIALCAGDNIYEVNNKVDKPINKIDKAYAIELLSEGFISLTDEESALGLEYSLKNTELPVLFTEGITDKIILENAWKKLNPSNEKNFVIQDCYSASFLTQMFKKGDDNHSGIFANYPDRIFMGLYDFDETGYNNWNNVKPYDLKNTNPYSCLTKQLKDKKGYLLLLPVPKIEEIEKQVIIKGHETFDGDSHLDIELLFYGIKELQNYYVSLNKPGGGRIVKFKGKKTSFAKETQEFPVEYFKNFKPLFDRIKQIVNQNQEEC